MIHEGNVCIDLSCFAFENIFVQIDVNGQIFVKPDFNGENPPHRIETCNDLRGGYNLQVRFKIMLVKYQQDLLIILFSLSSCVLSKVFFLWIFSVDCLCLTPAQWNLFPM